MIRVVGNIDKHRSDPDIVTYRQAIITLVYLESFEYCNAHISCTAILTGTRRQDMYQLCDGECGLPCTQELFASGAVFPMASHFSIEDPMVQSLRVHE